VRTNGPMIGMAVVYGLMGIAGAMWMRGEGFEPWPEDGLEPGPVLTAIGLGLAAGVGLHVAYRPFRGRDSVQPLEEVLFRGAMQPAFAFGIPLLGLAIASVAFGFAHFVPPRREFWMYPVLASIAGAVFGGCYLLTGGNLIAAFVAHLTVNLLNLRLMRDAIAQLAAETQPPPGMWPPHQPPGGPPPDREIEIDEQ